MNFNIIPIFSGAFCLFFILLVIIQDRNKQVANNFFLTIFIILGFLRVVPLFSFYLDASKYTDLRTLSIISFMFAVPLTFLAVKRTLSETPIKWKETCLHLIFPVVIVALLIVYLPVNAIAPLVGPEMNSTILLSVILWDVSYVLTVCIMGVRYLKKKPSNFLLTFKKNEIKRWVVIFLSFILLMSIGRWVNILSFDKLRGYNIIVLYDISSVFIVLIIIYLLKSPQLIFNDSLGKFNENRLREITF